VLNSVFLHHCVEAGLDMAIVNPLHITPYPEIDEERRKLADDLLFDRREDALARFIAFFQEHEEAREEVVEPTEEMSPDEAIHWMVLHRRKEGIQDFVDAAIQERGGGHQAAVDTLNTVLLPAMKEVGDRFGAGELILPFVLQSAEVMKAAVERLEEQLDRVEGETKGTVVLATVYGDVHDIGKNLVRTILVNNGYTVHDLGKQVPVNTIIEKAEEVGADAIGLSALLVSTSRQMPLCVQELSHRGLDYPVLVGGAAINPSFARRASFLGEPGEGTAAGQGEVYPPGVYYCKDAFDGLSAVAALTDPGKREAFASARETEVREGTARREELEKKARAARAGLGGSSLEAVAEIPQPDSWGVRVLERIPVEELVPLIDLNTLYRLHWGSKNSKGEEHDRLVREEFEPRLERYIRDAISDTSIRVRGAYGIFPAASQGEEIVVLDPADRSSQLVRFGFPRQHDRDRLCLADYLRPTSQEGGQDLVAVQIVTVGDEFLSRTEGMMNGGDYSEGYFLHGFGVRLAEAAAEYVHRQVREVLGIEPDRGLRYSWGYGACPDPRQHREVFRLLPAREQLGLDLTEAGVLVPELSTAALVVHHPQAKYFSV
jgi:5-methyltetrahydrofolate--homocysteine methyltransferase